MGCGCGLWQRCSLRGPGQGSRVSGFRVWLGFHLYWGFGSVWAVVTVAGLGSVRLSVVVPVVVCVGVLRLRVRLVTSGRGLAWRPAAVVCWVTGLGGGAAGRAVRRVVLCGA